MWLICFLIVLVWYYYYNRKESFTGDKPVCNKLDGRCYKVVSKFKEGLSDASRLLAELNKFNVAVMRHLRQKYIFEQRGNKDQRESVKRLLHNYNPDAIVENNPKDHVNTSFVEDKGKQFAICLRKKVGGDESFHSLHTLEFVVLHEMAHMANESFGHDRSFWQTFKFLLQEAKEAGIHAPIDYGQKQINYCQLDITYNPYFDTGL